jgi:hypothetical protein
VLYRFTTPFADFCEGLRASSELGRAGREGLSPPDDQIARGRITFDQPRSAPVR